jgi:carboxypeptidase C (cathepsin A)
MKFVSLPLGYDCLADCDKVELAAEFRGFYKSFVDTFQTKNWKTYITGESYAG